MIFYRAQPIESNSKEALFEKECPICGHRSLVPDHWMAFRYAPMATFRGLFLSFAIALLLSLVLCKIEFLWDFLSQFSYSMQEHIVTIFLTCFSIPTAFTIIHWEIKLGHLSEDDQEAIGVRCKHCRNAFVGLADAFPKSNSYDGDSTLEKRPEEAEGNHTTTKN